MVEKVFLTWFWPMIEISFLYAAGEFLMMFVPLIVFSNFYYTLGYDWNVVLAISASFYLMQ